MLSTLENPFLHRPITVEAKLRRTVRQICARRSRRRACSASEVHQTHRLRIVVSSSSGHKGQELDVETTLRGWETRSLLN